MSLDTVLSVVAVLIAGIVTAFVSYHARVLNQNRLKALEFKLAFVERQLSELYGPLHGLILLSQTAYAEILRIIIDDESIRKKLGVSLFDEDNNLFPPEDVIKNIRKAEASFDPYDFFFKSENFEQKRRWLKMCENEILERNDKIAQLITSNYHLLSPNTDHVPPSIEQLLHHISEFRIRNRIYAFSGPDPQLSSVGTPWPKDLVMHIQCKLKLLNALQNKYRTKIEQPITVNIIFRTFFKRKIDKFDTRKTEKFISDISNLDQPTKLQKIQLIHARTRARRAELLREFNPPVSEQRASRVVIREKEGPVVMEFE